jgi:hypothetical protein
MNSYNVMAGKPEGKRQLVKPRRRWDSIKIELKEI